MRSLSPVTVLSGLVHEHTASQAVPSQLCGPSQKLVFPPLLGRHIDATMVDLRSVRGLIINEINGAMMKHALGPPTAKAVFPQAAFA